ncbi:MAG: 4'-phosphopantetheinyl transferase superfamily protein [Rhodobacteraceae bacterium]|jgi:phosphopantetheinyl transferase|nr:4'-phosphopantetheinyl transferase superfamily protein [Paracoccaceae bacterium]MBL4558045.1 4'-phosphopantetheinyl transferase superfamily protein [Paracoccaceae bacterium]HBG98956.1 hypothetical protein [Paracoccaceae bacterium]
MRPPDPGAAMALLVRCPAVMPPTGTLSPGERERLRSFANRRAAIDFAAGRVVLRDVLGKFTGGPPDRVGLVLRAGRPVLSPNPLGLDVSLSHGGGYLCLAIARGLAVGADIENIPAPEGLGEMAALVMSPRECRVLDRLSGPGRAEAFCRLWTRREAALKGMGTGFRGNDRALSYLRPLAELRFVEGRIGSARWAVALPAAARFDGPVFHAMPVTEEAPCP